MKRTGARRQVDPTDVDRSIQGIYTNSMRTAFWIASTADEMFLHEAEILVKASGTLAWPMWTELRREANQWRWDVLVEGHKGDVLVHLGQVVLAKAGPEYASGTAWELREIDVSNPKGPEFLWTLLPGLPPRVLQAVPWDRLGANALHGDAPIAFPRLARRAAAAVR